MAKTISHSELLKATKKAVNSLMFNPSASKKQSAIEAIASLSNFIEAIEAPKEQPKPKASKSAKKPKASKAKSKSKSSRKAEIEAVLTSGKKLKRSERSVLNKELHRLLQEEKRKSKSKTSKKTVRRPKRSSAAGLEQAQAKTATANKVGKVKKTKVKHTKIKRTKSREIKVEKVKIKQIKIINQMKQMKKMEKMKQIMKEVKKMKQMEKIKQIQIEYYLKSQIKYLI